LRSLVSSVRPRPACGSSAIQIARHKVGYGSNFTSSSAAAGAVGVPSRWVGVSSGMRRPGGSAVWGMQVGCKGISPAVLVGARMSSRVVDEQSPPAAFAVVRLRGRQFKVSPGDTVLTERLPGSIGDSISMEDVLLVGTVNHTWVGQPSVAGASAKAIIEEHTLGEKVLVFKKKRRKGYRRLNGHRQPLSRLRVVELTIPGEETAVRSQTEQS